MAKQQLWRAHIVVVEQPNGYYTTNVAQFTDGHVNGSSVEYPNLSWQETADVIEATLSELSADRTAHYQAVVGVSPWVQLSLDGLLPLPG